MMSKSIFEKFTTFWIKDKKKTQEWKCEKKRERKPINGMISEAYKACKCAHVWKLMNECSLCTVLIKIIATMDEK